MKSNIRLALVIMAANVIFRFPSKYQESVKHVEIREETQKESNEESELHEILKDLREGQPLRIGLLVESSSKSLRRGFIAEKFLGLRIFIKYSEVTTESPMEDFHVLYLSRSRFVERNIEVVMTRLRKEESKITNREI